MKRFPDFFYWLEHGFSLPEAWNYARDPREPRTPAWRVYVAAVLLFLLVVAIVAAAVVFIHVTT